MKPLQEFYDSVRSYPDFPIPGVSFKDLSPIYSDPILFDSLIRILFESLKSKFSPFGSIVCPDARGFIAGSALAYRAGVPLILARKSGKLPDHSSIITREYGTEYSKTSISIDSSLLKDLRHPIIFDDILATGGTVRAVASILKDVHKPCIGAIFIGSIKALKDLQTFDGSLIPDYFALLEL